MSIEALVSASLGVQEKTHVLSVLTPSASLCKTSKGQW